MSGDLSAVAMMRDAFERRGKTMHRMLSEIPGVTCLEPQGAFYCYPNLTSLLGRDFGGRSRTPRWSSPTSCSTQAKVAFVPGEAFGTPGYARFSFALGDDDLGRGHPPHRRARRQLSVTATFAAVTEPIAARMRRAARSTPGASVAADDTPPRATT